ncbi:hypothetical protein SLE2022_074760 [Rubroshorea leprosula]
MSQFEGSMPMPSPPPSMPNDSMSPGDMSMIMHMSFYWGKDAIILFSGWPEGSAGMHVLALLFTLSLGVAIEVLSVSSAANPGKNPILGTFTQACVHAIRMGFAYMVMLAVLSYNLGIFIAALASHAMGFFVVRARALVTPNRAGQGSSTNATAKV